MRHFQYKIHQISIILLNLIWILLLYLRISFFPFVKRIKCVRHKNILFLMWLNFTIKRNISSYSIIFCCARLLAISFVSYLWIMWSNSMCLVNKLHISTFQKLVIRLPWNMLSVFRKFSWDIYLLHFIICNTLHYISLRSVSYFKVNLILVNNITSIY